MSRNAYYIIVSNPKRLEPKTEDITDYLGTKCHCNAIATNDDAGQTRRRRSRRLYYDRNKVKTTKISISDFNKNDNNRDNENNNKGNVTTMNKNSTNSNNGDVHATHHDNGHRSSMLNLPVDILESVDALTRVDQAVYKVALRQFLREMAWLESKLERQVLCDEVLQQWEPELAYLNVSLTSMYRDVKNAQI
jgi:hypothetical protein